MAADTQIDADTIASVLIARAAARTAHPLLVCDGERLSYQDAERRSARLARGLVALGIGKGSHVGLLYPNGTDFVVGMLAAARIGAVVVPFTTFGTARELGEQLADADVTILLATPSYRAHDYVSRLTEVLGVDEFTVGRPLYASAAPQLRHVAFDQDELASLADGVDPALLSALQDDVGGADPLVIVYTSGSTDVPKGAVHTHASVLGHQRNLNEIRGLSADDRLFCNSPFFWVGGLAFGLLATLVAGATLVCSNAVDAGDTLDLLETERPTLTNGFAASVAHLARHHSFARRDLSSMRRGNLYPIMPTDVRPADPDLRHNMLGMTEAGGTFLLHADQSDQPEARRGSFGLPAPGFEIKVVDPATGIEVEHGTVGELLIRGRYLMQRYHRRSREECFDADGWFHTGDAVRTDADGLVFYLGRRGTMIKTAGANVSPVEVQKAIARVTSGTVAHVIGLPDPERGEIVAAVLVTEHAVDLSALRALLARELSAFKLPRRIATVTEAPLLPSGKVDLRRLREVLEAADD
jgi:acyl-CoA synthetase (AMP-forming)/AMP-acid ligase II